MGSNYSLSSSLISTSDTSVEFEKACGQTMMTCPRRWYNPILNREKSRELLRSLPDKENYDSKTAYFIVRNSSGYAPKSAPSLGIVNPYTRNHAFTLDIFLPDASVVVSHQLRNSKENMFSEEMCEKYLLVLDGEKFIDFRSFLASRRIVHVPRVHPTMMRDDFIFRLVHHSSTEECDVYRTLENFDKSEHMFFELFESNNIGEEEEVTPQNLKAVYICLQSDGIETQSIKFEPTKGNKIYMKVRAVEFLTMDCQSKCLVEKEGDGELFTFQWQTHRHCYKSGAEARFDFSITVEWKTGQGVDGIETLTAATQQKSSSQLNGMDWNNGQMRCDLNNIISIRQLAVP